MKRLILLSVLFMFLSVIPSISYCEDLSCIRIFGTSYDFFFGTLQYKLGELYYQGNGNGVDRDVEYFRFNLKQGVKEVWESYGNENPQMNLRQFNPILKLLFQATDEDLAESSKAIKPEDLEGFGVYNTAQEYIFFIYVRQFYNHLLKGTVYKGDKLVNKDNSSLTFVIENSKGPKSFSFSKDYTITRYAIDTWKYVISNSVFATRFQTASVNCLQLNTLSFIALYSFMSAKFDNSNMSEDEFNGLKEQLLSALKRSYACVDFLNKLYVISFVAFSGIESKTFTEEIQKIRDYISMYQYVPSKGADPILVERDKKFFKDSLQTLGIGKEFSSRSCLSVMNRGTYTEKGWDVFRYDY